MPEIVWTPTRDRWEASGYARLAAHIGIDPADTQAVHGWSIEDPARFWDLVWDMAGIVGDRGDTALTADPERPMTSARFFPGARINLAENLMRLEGDALALIETDEAGSYREITAGTLRAEVARVAEGLRAAGVQQGDRVATILPNRFESLVSLLATAAVGGVWTSCSPDFGTPAIVDRIGQVEPKVLFAATTVRYGGKDVDLCTRIAEIADQMPSLTDVVIVGDGDTTPKAPVTRWDSFGSPAPLTFTRVPFDAPIFVLYTSGTTGKPKAIVHRTGGVTLKLLSEHLLHNDIRPGDRVMWYTNTAWMMYHWVVASMAQKAVLVLYDGAPALKAGDGIDGSPLWRVTEQAKLTHLGVSPKYLATLSDAGYVPKDHFDLSSLRWLFAAGSPMAPWQYDWMFQNISNGMGFGSISGGTEVMGCFLTAHPAKPVGRGTLTAKALGMATEVWNAAGQSVIDEPGELVCTKPFPSMPLTFWGENGDQRYHDTYFADRPEVWTHGDHATIHADGGGTIHGRSDFTLNPGGVRIGTADIYNICDRYAEIADSVVFGRPVGEDEEIVLCLKMADGAEATADLAKSLRTALRTECSPRHVPAAIYTVADIPYTINMKRVEGAAKAMATGEEVKNRASLANPGALAEFAELEARIPL